jgi:hypothetical protein
MQKNLLVISPFSLMLIPSVTLQSISKIGILKGAPESLIQFLRHRSNDCIV